MLPFKTTPAQADVETSPHAASADSRWCRAAKLGNCWCHPGLMAVCSPLGAFGQPEACRVGNDTGEFTRKRKHCALHPGETGHMDASCPHGMIPASLAPSQPTMVCQKQQTEGTSPEGRGQWWFARPESCQNMQRRCKLKHPAGSWEGVLTIRVFGWGHQTQGGCRAPSTWALLVCQLLGESLQLTEHPYAGFPRYTGKYILPHLPAPCYMPSSWSLSPTLATGR